MHVNVPHHYYHSLNACDIVKRVIQYIKIRNYITNVSIYLKQSDVNVSNIKSSVNFPCDLFRYNLLFVCYFCSFIKCNVIWSILEYCTNWVKIVVLILQVLTLKIHMYYICHFVLTEYIYFIYLFFYIRLKQIQKVV